MTSPRETFRLAIRKFDAFEQVIDKQWRSFCEHSGCSLKLEAVPLDLHDLYDALFGNGGLKNGDWDVGFVVTDWLAEAEASGSLLDLASRLRENPPDDFPAGWTDSLLRYQRFGDKVLGVPYHDGPECLIYRKDIFEKAGKPPPATWGEFQDLARTLTDEDRRLWGTAFAAYPDGHNTVYDFCLQLWTRGGELFDSDGKLHLETPEAEEALTFYRAIVNDPKAVHPDCRENDSVRTGLAFARGEIAFMINWFGFAAMAEGSPDSAVSGSVGVAPLPAAPGKPSASLNVYWLLGIGSGSPHADIAYDFIRHCASPENDRLLTLDGGIGCRKSTWHDGEVNRRLPFYSRLEAIHEDARELPRLGHWAELARVIDRLVTAVIDTERPVGELLSEAQADADNLQ